MMKMAPLISFIILVCFCFMANDAPAFTVDMIMNGILDSDYSYSDNVEVDITEKNRFAIDLSLSSTIPPRSYGPERPVVFIGDEGLPNIEGKELTIEAWVKKSDNGFLDPIINMDNAGGGSFRRDYQKGFRMFLSDNKPSFNITRDLHEPEPFGCTSNYPTSTSTCVVNSFVPILKNIWTHIAGVLVNEEHVHPESESCTPAVMNEKPHLDLYVNGEFQDCATSGEQFAGGDPHQFMTIGSRQYCLGCGIHSWFYGTLDEIRFWTVARTEQEIQKCMNFELGTTPECPIDSSILKGYWKFNEGEGSTVNDISGNGLSGVIEITPFDYADYELWDGAWAPGYKFLIDNDGDGIPSDEDCDDNDPNNYPGNTEVCDGRDNDCNGMDDVLGFEGSETDNDGDGYSECQSDCDDSNMSINPDAYEVPGNTTDENCDATLACDPDANWKNHGQFVRCVAHEVTNLVKAGYISQKEGNTFINSAAKSDAGKK